ncbi:MAG: stage II sporulation protein R [Bacillota bacterium]
MGQAIVLALTAGVILFAGWGFSQASRAEKAYTPNNLIMGPSENVIRLHIPANSDSSIDQEVKEEIRDRVMAEFGPQLKGEGVDAAEAEAILRAALSEIEQTATAHLKAKGLPYSAAASVKTLHFPEMTYNLEDGRTLYLAEGEYKALQVKLGSGTGRNWWCVMYPPLCYSDLVQRGIVPGSPVTSSGEEGLVRNLEGVLLVDNSLAEEVRVEVRSLFLDAIRAGMARVGEVLSYVADAATSACTAPNVE